ncbi:MAG: diaminopimelate epimerase [Chitinispirillaceae bacterium]|nr:diaminopimelate epimerase [Chitinispirillaceae bacterium]
MNFIKMEGIGNDFVVTHEFPPGALGCVAETAVALCDRRRGIGGDGLILILPSDRADFHMRIFNSDGSEAEMCGNGIRCCVNYINLLSLSPSRELAIETAAGIIGAERGENGQVRVDMGPPRLRADQVPVVSPHDRVLMEPLSINGVTFNISAVSMGNPHAVIYADNLSDNLVLGFGPRIETHPSFPNKTNVEFVMVLSDTEIRMRVWERGCGETQACGTGACAAAVAGILNRFHGNRVTVHLPGGDLLVEWSGESADPVFMTGPARAVYTGSYPLQE